MGSDKQNTWLPSRMASCREGSGHQPPLMKKGKQKKETEKENENNGKKREEKKSKNAEF